MIATMVLLLSAVIADADRPSVALVTSTGTRQELAARERFTRALSADYEVVLVDVPKGVKVRDAARNSGQARAFILYVRVRKGTWVVRVEDYSVERGAVVQTIRATSPARRALSTTFWRSVASRLPRAVPQTAVADIDASPESQADDWDAGALQFDEVEHSVASDSLLSVDGRLDLQYHRFRRHDAGDPLYARESIEARLGATFGTSRDFLRAEGDIRRDFATPERNRIAFIEAFASGAAGPLRLRIGHQLTSWGSTTLVVPSDVMDRIDLRDVLRPEKIASLSARLSLTLGRALIELYALPRPVLDRLPLETAAELGDTKTRAMGLDNLQGAARIALALPALDVSFALAYMYDHVPNIVVASPVPYLGQRRLWIATFDFETTLGKTRFAFDAAGFKPQDGNRAYAIAVAGVDYATAQFFTDHSVHFFLEGELARRAETMGPASLLDAFRTPFARAVITRVIYDAGDLARASAGAYIDLETGAAAFNVTLEAKIVTGVHARIGGDILTGRASTLFGRYRDDSRVFIEATAAF